VREIAERLGEFPGGEGVGAVALVHDGEGALEQRIAEILIERRDLGGHHQTLVDDGPRREAWDVEAFFPVQHAGDGLLTLSAGHVQSALESVAVQPGRVGEALPD